MPVAHAFRREAFLRRLQPVLVEAQHAVPPLGRLAWPSALRPQRGVTGSRRGTACRARLYAESRCKLANISSRSVGRRPLLRLWRRRRRRELGVIDRDVLLQLVHLDSEPIAGARQRPAEGNLHAVGVAVIAVVDLRG
jgi:hypothetical protein